MSKQQPIVSVTRDDCEWIFQRGRGNGGQKKNKTNSAVICTHRPSNSQGYAEDHREQGRNRELAFVRMVETKTFQSWLKKETLNKLGILKQIEAKVEKDMSPSNLKIEIKNNKGNWEEVSPQDLLTESE